MVTHMPDAFALTLRDIDAELDLIERYTKACYYWCEKAEIAALALLECRLVAVEGGCVGRESAHTRWALFLRTRGVDVGNSYLCSCYEGCEEKFFEEFPVHLAAFRRHLFSDAAPA